MRRPILFVILVALILCLSACVPGSYPPPPQYETPRGPDPPVLQLGFSNPHVKILGDVFENAGVKGSRWTGAHPHFSFQLDRTNDLDFYLYLGVHDKPFATTGPVTLTIRVNGEVIDKPRFETPGIREYTHPVAERTLRLRNPVDVVMDVDPPWLSEDKEILGVVLFAVGFAEHNP